MRNLGKLYSMLLKKRFRTLRAKNVSDALRPFHPMGFCAAVSAGNDTEVFFDGDAVFQKQPVDAQTIFRIASISKIFIGAAVARLEKQNKLALDEDVSEFLGFPLRNPRYPHAAVTLRQLLTHTAGIRDTGGYHVLAGTENAPPLCDFFLPDAAPKNFFAFAPGTEFAYSNFGAGIAGMAVEAVSGKFYDDFIREEFLQGMDASFHPQRIVNQARMANCYRMPKRELAYDAQKIAALALDDSPNPMAHYAVPAGKLMISAPDLLKALQKLSGEEAILKPQSHQGSVKMNAGRTLSFACISKGIFGSSQMLGHQGMAYGAVCEAWFQPESGEAAVLLTNGLSMKTWGPMALGGQAGMAALLDRKRENRV